MMRILIQLILFCLLFTALVKYAVRGGAVDGLFFYPKAVQEKVFELGLSDPETMAEKRKRFMPVFVIVMLAALLHIVGVWNRPAGFREAHAQCLLFLEVMNWYDGIVIDRLWVGHDPFWILPGTEGIPFVQTWPQVLKKRLILTVVWIVLAVIPAGIITAFL